MLESLRPDPTFHPTPRLAMQAERERLCYTALLSRDRSRPDALAVVDLDAGSPTYGQVLHRLDMSRRAFIFSASWARCCGVSTWLESSIACVMRLLVRSCSASIF